jgi:hypothetical protein
MAPPLHHRHHHLLPSLLLLALDPAAPASYRLEKVTAHSEADGAVGVSPQRSQGVPGLYVGSGLAFKADCVNVDVEGIADESGATTTPGELYALVAEGPRHLLSDTEPETLYFLQHDSTKRFPFDTWRFEWIMSEHFVEHGGCLSALLFLSLSLSSL